VRILEFFIIGGVVILMFAAGFSLGSFYEREIRPRAESVIERVPDRELNMPLLPEVPDRAPTRTRF
jgi:hypothetical protein